MLVRSSHALYYNVLNLNANVRAHTRNTSVDAYHTNELAMATGQVNESPTVYFACDTLLNVAL